MKFADIKNLLFDLDGTLIDSSAGVIEATNYALAQIGEEPRSPSEIKSFIGFSLESMFTAFSTKSYREFWNHFQEMGLDRIELSAKPIDGADQVLRTLWSRQYKIGIGTLKMRVHVDKILRKLGWESIILAYVGADDVEHVKPAPDVYLKVMSLLGGTPGDSLVIGDTVNDVLAARAAGLPIVAIKSPFGNTEDLIMSGPDVCLDSIKELPFLLARK